MNTRMKQAREAAKLSQKAVALSLHVSAPIVSEWESGKKCPSLSNLKEIALLYNVSADYLLGIENRKTPVVSNERPLVLSNMEESILTGLQQLSEDQQRLLLALLTTLLNNEEP